MREIIRLPEPAGTLWDATRDPLESAVRECIPDFDGWKFSGGTILAAQWKHRTSKDIDLKVHPHTGLVWLEPQNCQRFHTTLQVLNVREVTYRRNQVAIELDAGRIDIFGAKSIPSAGHEIAMIHGNSEEVLSNCQILSDKISGRGLRRPVRDLFDLAVASEADFLALAIATNAMYESRVHEMNARWSAGRQYFRTRAVKELWDVPSKWQDIANNLAEAAVEAVRNAIYKNVRIQWKDGSLKAILEFHSQPQIEILLETSSSEKLEYDLERYGLNAYFQAMEWKLAAKVRKRIEESSGKNGETVFETSRGGIFVSPGMLD